MNSDFLRQAELLLSAIHQGNFRRATALLDQNRSLLRFKDPVLDDEAIHIAARYNRTKILRMLVERGSDLNAPGDHGFTPLHHAAKVGSYLAAKALVELGAIPDIETADGYSPLRLGIVCEEDENPTVWKMLLEHGVRIDLPSAVLLLDADRVQEILRNDPGATRHKLAHEFVFDAISTGRDSELRFRITNQSTQLTRCIAIIEALLKAGIDPDLISFHTRQTPLQSVAKKPFPLPDPPEVAKALVDCLIRCGADPNNVGELDKTPLFIATSTGNLAVAAALVRHGATE